MSLMLSHWDQWRFNVLHLWMSTDEKKWFIHLFVLFHWEASFACQKPTRSERRLYRNVFDIFLIIIMLKNNIFSLWIWEMYSMKQLLTFDNEEPEFEENGKEEGKNQGHKGHFSFFPWFWRTNWPTLELERISNFSSDMNEIGHFMSRSEKRRKYTWTLQYEEAKQVFIPGLECSWKRNDFVKINV